MKVQVNIFKIETGEKIGEFTTTAKNIQNSFYHFINRRYAKFNVCATECYYRLSDV